MSKRGWKKLKEEKQRRKAERKADIKRANAPIVGREAGPGGYPLLDVRCPACDLPTTEIWSFSSGATGCGRCAHPEDSAMFAVVRERRGELVVTHTVTPETTLARPRRAVPVSSPPAAD